MLPSTLLLETIHCEELSREHRIDNVLLGASFVILYKIILTNARDNLGSSHLDTATNIRQTACFTHAWCCEYISTALGIASLLIMEESVNLGACGTHYLEHMFGSIRRLSRGDDTHKRFISSMRKMFLERYLYMELGIQPDIPKRRSDSGIFVNDKKIDSEKILFPFLVKAKRMMNHFIDFPEELGLEHYASQQDKMNETELKGFYNAYFLPTKHTISTKITKKTSTGAFSNCRRWKANEQI